MVEGMERSSLGGWSPRKHPSRTRGRDRCGHGEDAPPRPWRNWGVTLSALAFKGTASEQAHDKDRVVNEASAKVVKILETD
jgi:hypothetical protein